MSTILRPISKFAGKSLSSTSSLKLGLYAGMATLSTVGFYRGCKEYHYAKTIIEEKEFNSSDYFYCSIFGLIGASTYVNPSFSAFAVYYEYLRLKMSLAGEDSKKIAESNIMFYLLSKKKI
jgi:hypothetical protein